jgi:tRNA(fMet)-specific endonuclease VapC
MLSIPKIRSNYWNNNLWLAAHARANNWVMVTNNEKEFLRVDGLQVENWISKSL